MVAFTVQLRIFSLEESNYRLKTCMIGFLGRGGIGGLSRHVGSLMYG